MISDIDLALAFFNRIKEKGFGIEIVDFGGNSETDEEFDPDNISINLKDSTGNTFASFDFLGGNFYRISATDSTGWYGDEVDLRKYV